MGKQLERESREGRTPVNTAKQYWPLYIVVNAMFSNKTYTTAAMKTVKASKAKALSKGMP